MWTSVYALEEERIVIADRAARAGLSVSAYLIRRGLQDQVVARSDWQHAVARLTEVNARLADVSALLEDRAAPLDAVRLGLLLLRIEAAARGILTPEQQAIARLAEGIDLAALGVEPRGGAQGREGAVREAGAAWPDDTTDSEARPPRPDGAEGRD